MRSRIANPLPASRLARLDGVAAPVLSGRFPLLSTLSRLGLLMVLCVSASFGLRPRRSRKPSGRQPSLGGPAVRAALKHYCRVDSDNSRKPKERHRAALTFSEGLILELRTCQNSGISTWVAAPCACVLAICASARRVHGTGESGGPRKASCSLIVARSEPVPPTFPIQDACPGFLISNAGPRLFVLCLNGRVWPIPGVGRSDADNH
jgi:hypothetical protein